MEPHQRNARGALAFQSKSSRKLDSFAKQDGERKTLTLQGS